MSAVYNKETLELIGKKCGMTPDRVIEFISEANSPVIKHIAQHSIWNEPSVKKNIEWVSRLQPGNIILAEPAPMCIDEGYDNTVYRFVVCNVKRPGHIFSIHAWDKDCKDLPDHWFGVCTLETSGRYSIRYGHFVGTLVVPY